VAAALTIATSLGNVGALEHAYVPTLDGLTAERRSYAYWRSVVTFFATSRRMNPGARHVLFTNWEAIPRVDGVDVERFLAGELGVDVERIAFRHSPPATLSRIFGNAFFKFDAVMALAREASDANVHLDCDCVWVRPGVALQETLRARRIVVYDCYGSPSPAKKIHNVSRLDLAEAFRRLDPAFPCEAPLWIGGEFVGGTRQGLAELASRLEEAFASACRLPPDLTPRLPNGHSVFDNDEYLLSMACARAGVCDGYANGMLERIYTSVFYRTVRADQMGLTVWHLPHEKAAGLSRLFREATHPASAFWRLALDEAFPAYLGGFVGIPRLTVRKACRDAVSMLRRKVRQVREGRVRSRWRELGRARTPL
jgi:hypothetical protein